MYAREEEKKRDSRKKTPLYLTIVPSPEKEPHVHLQAPSFPSPPPPGLSVYSRPTAPASSWLWLLVARCSSLQYGPASASPAGDALKYRDSAIPPVQLFTYPARAVRCSPPAAGRSSTPDRRPRRGQTQGQSSSDAACPRSAAPCPETTIHAKSHALYMYGRRPHSLLSCRLESCTSHPCLVPGVGRLLGRDVSRAPAASPGACAQHVRLWQYGHARHERNRGTFFWLLTFHHSTQRPA